MAGVSSTSSSARRYVRPRMRHWFCVDSIQNMASTYSPAEVPMDPPGLEVDRSSEVFVMRESVVKVGRWEV